MKKQKMFYTSDGVKIIGYSNAKEFNKALEEWTKKNKNLVRDYPETIEKMKMTEDEVK
tara:strand:- start:419 stop:592 length:174 start_codon:yes stop_codon:yes gene_type:complete